MAGFDRLASKLGGVQVLVDIDSGGTVGSDHTLSAATDGFDRADVLWVGTAGDVTLTIQGTDVTLHNVAAGVFHRINYTAVKTSGTTAEDVMAGVLGPS